jgi:phytoene dehydrogenase-like protein
LHNIFFAENYKNEFTQIFQKKTVPVDPTVYVHVSSKACSSDAPEGKESWFVMINVPANTGQNWQELRMLARERVLHKLGRILNENIEALIEVEDYLDPVRIEQRTSSAGGALYGTSSNSRMAAFFRHPNVSRIKNLLFVGGSVHPGGGIPLCLLSAKIATEEWRPV